MNTTEPPARRPGPAASAGKAANPDLSREAVPGQKVALAPGQLQLRPTRRGKPPAHLADLTLAERISAVEEMGLPAFRAKQLSVHYFEHFTTDPEDLTDLPKDSREALVERFFGSLFGASVSISEAMVARGFEPARLADGGGAAAMMESYTLTRLRFRPIDYAMTAALACVVFTVCARVR